MALGRLGDPADGDCLLVEAVARSDDEVVAMLSLVPWGTNGVSLDLMRRSPQSPNGTIELMVSELCMQAEGIGVTPDFAELRDVPLGVRAGRTARRRPGRAVVARLAGVLLAMVAAGDAVPVEHEVPARSGCRATPAMRTPGWCPRVGVASVIAEGFLVLPFSRRHEQRHTGHHTAVPQNLMATGLLHHDGTRPGSRRLGRQTCPTDDAAATARTGSGTDGQAQGLAGQRDRRLSRRRRRTEPHGRGGAGTEADDGAS